MNVVELVWAVEAASNFVFHSRLTANKNEMSQTFSFGPIVHLLCFYPNTLSSHAKSFYRKQFIIFGDCHLKRNRKQLRIIVLFGMEISSTCFNMTEILNWFQTFCEVWWVDIYFKVFPTLPMEILRGVIIMLILCNQRR